MRKYALLLCMLMAFSAISTVAEVHTLVVLSQDDHSVYDINPVTGAVLKQVRLDGVPRDAIFSWDEQHIFVALPELGEVAIVDVTTFKQTGKIVNPAFKRTGGGVLGLSNSADGEKLYVGGEGGLYVYDPKLLIFNPEVNQPGKKIAISARDGQYFKPQGTTDKLYYPFRSDNQVVVVDTKTDNVVATVPVKGGPMDVVFVIGNEAWVQCEDGTIALIDTAKDVVKQTIQTGGKGAGRISIAADMRYVASTHKDSGDVTLLNPVDKKVVGTIKTGAGTSAASFAPINTGKDWVPDATTEMYVSNATSSELLDVDLATMAVAHRQKLGSGLTANFIHYTYGAGFAPPREGTDQRLLETDLFTAYTYRMFLYDVSPVHQHRGDMVGVWIGTGTAKNGCWDPTCPSNATNQGVGSGKLKLPYNNGDRITGSIMQQRRGVIHQEEGGSNSPPMSIMFEMKNNYYRQHNLKKVSALADAGFRKLYETPRAIGWETTIWPGDKPLVLPEGDFAQVYLGGGLLRLTQQDGKPQIIHRFYGDWDYTPGPHKLEALTNANRIIIVEFK